MTSTTRTSEQHSDALRRANGAMADRLFKGAAYGSGLLILGLLAAVAVFLLMRAWPAVAGPRSATQAVIASFTGGRFDSFVQYVGPLLFGSVLVAALALAIAFFVSIGIAIFISQYAPRRFAAFLSGSVAAPTRITATPPASFASLSCSFAFSYSGVVSSICILIWEIRL